MLPLICLFFGFLARVVLGGGRCNTLAQVPTMIIYGHAKDGLNAISSCAFFRTSLAVFTRWTNQYQERRRRCQNMEKRSKGDAQAYNE